MTEAAHSLTLHTWFSDHKRGWARPTCEGCDWVGQVRRVSRTVWSEEKDRFLAEWRWHLPSGRYPHVDVTEDESGAVETGQAYVHLEGQDTLVRALRTRLTPVALHVVGFDYEIGDLADARSLIYPAVRVREVEVAPWWDRDDIFERDMDKPQEATDEEASYASEC